MLTMYNHGFDQLVKIDESFAIDVARFRSFKGWPWQAEQESAQQRNPPSWLHQPKTIRYWTLKAAEEGNVELLTACYDEINNGLLPGVPDHVHLRLHLRSLFELAWSALNKSLFSGHRRTPRLSCQFLFGLYRTVDLTDLREGVMGYDEEQAVYDGLILLSGNGYVDGHEEGAEVDRVLQLANEVAAAARAGRVDGALDLVRYMYRHMGPWSFDNHRCLLDELASVGSFRVLKECVISFRRFSKCYSEFCSMWMESAHEGATVYEGTLDKLLLRDDPEFATSLVPTHHYVGGGVGGLWYAILTRALMRGHVGTGRVALGKLLGHRDVEELYRSLTVDDSDAFDDPTYDPIHAALSFLDNPNINKRHVGAMKVRIKVPRIHLAMK